MRHPVIPALSIVLLFALVAALGMNLPVGADLIRLKSGGEIRGEIPRDNGATNGSEVRITTLAGTVIVVARDQIDFVTRRPLKIEEYETRARRTPDTVDAQWELAEWCRKQNLRGQRDEHLERILALDPDHEKAHYGLKHTNVEGVWMTREERMQSQGYVKHKGGWMTPQELELTEKTLAEREREQAWFQKIHLWKNWLTGTHASRSRDAHRFLLEIRDPDAVPALVKNFQDDQNKRLRELYVAVLANVPGPKPVQALVNQSLNDGDLEVRYAALNAISSEQYETAGPFYVRELKNGLNVIVRRAAKALERMADDRAVPALIDALVTTHRYRVRVPDSGGMGFSTDGNYAGGGTPLPLDVELALRSGQINGVIINQPMNQIQRQPKYAYVNYDHQNTEVLATLRKVTGQRFGYQERTWKLWHAAQKNGAGPNAPVLP